MQQRRRRLRLRSHYSFTPITVKQLQKCTSVFGMQTLKRIWQAR